MIVNWKIEWMKSSTASESTGYVVECGWRCTGEDSGFSASAYGSCSFKVNPDQTDVIPYEELTEDIVLHWCWDSGVEKDQTEANVMQQVETLKNPPNIVAPLPWASTQYTTATTAREDQ